MKNIPHQNTRGIEEVTQKKNSFPGPFFTFHEIDVSELQKNSRH